ncbi:6-carboxytetrahydropterin synthase [Myxococcota bacterium]|nr:6-carboxytetrahydropterin synthase [Myxococcota bacterium]
MLRLTRAIEFSASLTYRRPELSEDENRRLFGRKAHQHGHNYRLEVTLRGEPDSTTGMVIDLKELQEILEREIMTRFDHRDLNADTPYFEKLPPTPEHFVQVIRRLLVAALPGGMLDRIRLCQEEDLWVDWIEPLEDVAT